jgi:hypothetical protein
MRHVTDLLLLLITFVVINLQSALAAESPSYSVMQDDLKALKDDFNLAAGRMRLVFIISPT